MEPCYSHFLHKAFFSISLAERPFYNTAAAGAGRERGRSGGGGGSASASSRGGLAGSGHPAHRLAGRLKSAGAAGNPLVSRPARPCLPLLSGTARAPPASWNPASRSASGRFPSRGTSVSSAAREAAQGGGGVWGGRVSGSGALRGAGMLGDTGREERLRGHGCLLTLLCGRAAPEPGARLGRMGSPAGRVPVSHREAQGGLGSTEPRCPPGPARDAAPVGPSPPALSPGACAAAPSLSRPSSARHGSS